MRRKSVKYVLIMPRCTSLVEVAIGLLIETVALGPTFSSQVWSSIWLAIVCPRTRLVLGISR